MRLKTPWQNFFGLVCILAFLTTGCTAQAPADTTPIRIAVLPIVEGLPLYTAQDGGFFEKQGLKVQFINAGSAAERDQLIAAGQADGMINDLLAVTLFNRQSAQLQIVRFAHVSTPGSPLYVIAAAPQSGIKTVQDLAGVEIGISQSSIIDYATSRILSNAGLKADQIRTVAVPKIPDRMSLLLSGQIKAATLPQPFAALALKSGAVAIVDDTQVADLGNSVISFRKSFIDEHPQVVKSFVSAIDQATTDLNANPEKYRSLLGTYKVVPDTLLAAYPIPKFPDNSLPNQKQFEDVVAFALERKLIDTPVKFTDSVNPAFLSK
jgi:NitT/TauT family transport system substrate-binding protein